MHDLSSPCHPKAQPKDLTERLDTDCRHRARGRHEVLRLRLRTKRKERLTPTLLTVGHRLHMVRAAPNPPVSMSRTVPSLATLALRIFLPFAFAYFLSYIYRG